MDARPRTSVVRIMRARAAVPALVVLIAALVGPVRAQPAQPPAQPAGGDFDRFRERFHGTWRLTIPMPQARRTVDAAIEQTVGAMNFFVRSVARGQLRDNTPLNRRIDLYFRDGGRINVRFDDRFSYTTRMGRTTRFRTPEGDEMRVTQRFRGERL